MITNCPMVGRIGCAEVSLGEYEENEVTFTFEGRIRNDANNNGYE